MGRTVGICKCCGRQRGGTDEKEEEEVAHQGLLKSGNDLGETDVVN